jgi:hypothetical protein
MSSMLVTLTMLMVEEPISPMPACSRVQCTARPARPFPHRIVLIFAAKMKVAVC